MFGPLLVLLGIFIVCPSSQGQKSSPDTPASNFSLNLEGVVPRRTSNKGDGTSLTKQDFINGEKLESTTLEEAKKTMHLTLKNKNQFVEDPSKPGKDRSIQREVKYRWPNNEVPYKIETVFTEDEKAKIASAIQNIQDNSCVTFRPATSTDLDYIYIFTTNASGCTGHRFYGPGYGEHHLNLEGDSGDGLTCIVRGVIIHELLHMLGVNHEHQRPDRDTMVTVNWANVQVDKAHNLFRDSWDTEDLTVVPICNATGAVQETADFSGCVSGDVVTAYGVGYDFYSVMHYEFDSFAVDPSVPTMVPFDASITSPGNVELSTMDITKLQKSYGCSGCGGYKRSSVGGTITETGNSDLLSPCEWVLETDSGKGISIDISTLTGADCSTDYVEVRLGSSSSDELVGKYCADSLPSGPVKVGSSTVWVKWGKSSVDSSMSLLWSGYEVVCCQVLLLENLSNLANLKFNMTDQQEGGRAVYKLIGGLADVYYLYWYSGYGWFVGADPTSSSIIAANKGQNICPESTTVAWEYATEEGLVPDDDAKLRCTDCTLYPAYPECEECCDTVTLSSTFSEFLDTSQYYSQFYGQFTYNGVDHNDHKVYQSDGFNNVCLFFSNFGNWIIYYCNDLNTSSRWITAPGTKCAHQASGWVIYSQTSGEDVPDESLSFTCPETTPASKPSIPQTTPTTTKLPLTYNHTPVTEAGCLPCKTIEEGPMMGSYLLEDMTTQDTRCVDGCVYSNGEDLYCFARGEDFVRECK